VNESKKGGANRYACGLQDLRDSKREGKQLPSGVGKEDKKKGSVISKAVATDGERSRFGSTSDTNPEGGASWSLRGRPSGSGIPTSFAENGLSEKEPRSQRN